MGGAPDGVLPPIVHPFNIPGMRNAPHYGQPYSFTRKMVGRFYQDNSLKAGPQRKEQPSAAELRKKAANAQRLQVLKLQYSERRKLVETDLMREAMHIQQMEAKLMQIQQQRQGGVRRRSNSEVLVINHPSYGQPAEGGLPAEYMKSYGSQQSYSPRSVFSNHLHDGGEEHEEEEGEEPESDDDDYGQQAEAGSRLQHPPASKPPSYDRLASSPDMLSKGERQHPQARRRPRARSMPTLAPPPASSSSSVNSHPPRDAAASPRRDDAAEAAGGAQVGPEAPAKQQEEGSRPGGEGPLPPSSVTEAGSSSASSVVEPARALDPSRVELRQLSVEEIGKMLKNHSLGLYEDIFATNCVDGETLTDPTLTEADLSELGIKIRLHRKRLLDLITRFKTDGVPLSDLTTPVVPLDLMPSPVRVASAARLQRQASREGLGSRRASSRQSLLCQQYGLLQQSPAPPGSRGTSLGSLSGLPSPTKTVVLHQSRAGTADSSASGVRLVRSRQSSFRPIPVVVRSDMRTEEEADQLPPQPHHSSTAAGSEPAGPVALASLPDSQSSRQPVARPMTREDDESSAGFASDFEDQGDTRESVADIFY